VAGMNSAKWPFRHNIVDKQYYSPSLGITVCFLFYSFLLFDYVKTFVEKGLVFYQMTPKSFMARKRLQS